MQEIHDPQPLGIVEISYKQGARKEFVDCPEYLGVVTGEMVVVDEGNGYNIGRVSLTGELVGLQMRKKRVQHDRVVNRVVRRANDRDLERLRELGSIEKQSMIRARAIARTLGVNLKVGDVEYRGDGRKATFYYTADGRIDFRELVRHYAKEFRVKIEMRQIGARQESARIGGLGSCGRELCCSTWLTDFKSVNTSAARYQNLSINQTKLSGQCGRLKCCLNYELDTYLDALQDFPKNVDRLKTKKGTATLIKTDIFKKLMFYAYETERGKSSITPVDVERVKAVQKMNMNGEIPNDLLSEEMLEEAIAEKLLDYEDVTGAVELPAETRKRRSRRGGRRRGRKPQSGNKRSGNRKGKKPQGSANSDSKPKGGKGNPRKGKPRNPKNRNGNQNKN